MSNVTNVSAPNQNKINELNMRMCKSTESLRILREANCTPKLTTLFSHTKTNCTLFLAYSLTSTFDSTMKRRETAKVATGASNSDGDTNEKTEKNENGDENAAPEKSKTTESSAENAENAEENGTVDKSTEDVNDADKVNDATTADDADAKKTTNGKKSLADKKSSQRKFIRLTCPHCRAKSVKFQVKLKKKIKNQQ